MLIKEPDNEYDSEAIFAFTIYRQIDMCNSTYTVYDTISAGRLMIKLKIIHMER